MKINTNDSCYKYTNLYERVTTILDVHRRDHLKSPTIKELSLLTGRTEEMILESLEYGHIDGSGHLLH